MNHEFLNTLNGTVEQLLDWDTSSIIISLSTDLQSVPIPINIMDTVGAGTKVLLEDKNRFRYWFPSTVFEQKDLVNIIAQLCIEKGFGVAVSSGGTKKALKTTNVVPDKRVVISCSRGRVARPSRRVRDGTSSSDRPFCNEDKCNFRIIFYQCNRTKRWYIQKFGDGCKHHHSHYHLDPNQVKTRSAVVPKEEMERVMNQLSKNIPTKAIQTLLRQQTGITLSVEQIRRLKQSVHETHMLTESSPAQRLISTLNSDPDIEYVAYIAKI